jgi:type I restriction enzyme S subunit
MSQLFGWEGALALGSEKFAGMYLSPQFPTFLCEATKLDRAFLGWLMRRPTFWADLGSRASGMGDRRRTLTPDALFKCEIPLPPLSDQRRIVARLEELGAQIEEACRLRKEALKGAEGLFEQARAQVFKQAPSHGVRTLSETATLERGKFSHRPRNDQQFFGGNHPWIQIAEIERSTKYIREWSETLNDAGLAISKKFPKGTVLISIAATIGAVGILDFDCCIPDSIVGVTPKEGMDSEFLYHYLAYVRTILRVSLPRVHKKISTSRS